MTKREELKKQIQEAETGIIQEVKNYSRSKEDIFRLLNFMNKFYKYSFNNTVLIAKQWQGAQVVGSYNSWKKKGFCVNKGEKAKIKILVPVTVTTFINKEGKKKGLKYGLLTICLIFLSLK